MGIGVVVGSGVDELVVVEFVGVELVGVVVEFVGVVVTEPETPMTIFENVVDGQPRESVTVTEYEPGRKPVRRFAVVLNPKFHA